MNLIDQKQIQLFNYILIKFTKDVIAHFWGTDYDVALF